MFRQCQSYADQSRCVSELADACLALKRKLGYSEPDARSVALDNIAGIARAGQMTLNLLDSWTRGDDTIRQVIPQLIGLTTVTPQGVQVANNIMNKSGKLALVVLAQFQVENAIRNVARELGLSIASAGFYRCAAELLSALTITQDRLEVLNTPARVRNSLHSNGIHRRQHPNESPVTVIKGVQYEFRDGQRVTCASWEHIAHALEGSVDVLEETFRSPRVLAIKDPMMDEYAWDMETAP
jgi:hypothetical protein